MGNRIFVGVVVHAVGRDDVVADGGPHSAAILSRRAADARRAHPRRARLLGNPVRRPSRSATPSARRFPARWARRKSTAACCSRASRFSELAPQWMGSLVRGLGEISLDIAQPRSCSIR